MSGEIEKAQRLAVEGRREYLLSIELDTGGYLIWEKPFPGEEEFSQEYDSSGLVFTRARNSRKEVSGGQIDFLLFPDGTKEFGLILVYDPESESHYTLFLNPYFFPPEIFKGEIDFDSQYP